MGFINVCIFIVFLALVTVCLHFLKTADRQNKLLLISSFIFYSVWDLRFLVLLFIVTVTSYYSALNKSSKIFRIIGVATPLVFLCISKYLNFFLDSFCQLFGRSSFGFAQIALPLGISFYSFLAISYVCDVFNGKLPPEKNFTVVALYISFFPTIISGPITKARDVFDQLKQYHYISSANVCSGIQLILLGCLKKFVLADNMSILVDEVYAVPLAFNSATVWLAVVTYSLQLYLDFSGYSDIAIGCGRMMGIRLAENFNLPYLAKNVNEFWKRWHMSLSAWLQEYLYFRLGGSRESDVKTYRNLLVTMIICGLWHGAAWNFVLWGLIHGILLCGYRIFDKYLGPRIYIPDVLSIALTFLTVTMCWIFFRGGDIETISQIFNRLFIWEAAAIDHMFIWAWAGILAMGFASIIAVTRHDGNGFRPTADLSTGRGFFTFCLALYVLASFFYTGNNPFAYAGF